VEKVENAITSSEMKKVMLAWDRVVNEKKRTYPDGFDPKYDIP
jgi:hypothetical protein